MPARRTTPFLRTNPAVSPSASVKRALAWCLAAIGLCAPASGGPDLGQVVSRMPLSVDFVAALDDGSALRRDLRSSPLMLAVASMSRPAAIMNAWTDLSNDLGLTDAEAFDLLLGQRVVVVGSQMQPDDPGEPRWAILSELDPETERRLRTLLKAVPRRIVAGQPVLEFEHGSFLLATSSGRLRCRADGRFDNNPASSIMLLAPTADRELFEQMLPLLRCDNPDNTLADIPAGEMMASWKTRDAVLIWRLPDAQGSSQRFIGATIGTEDAEWTVDAVAYPTDGWAKNLDVTTIEPWKPSLLGTLPPNPVFAMMGSREAVAEARDLVDPVLGSLLPDPQNESFARLLGRRSMLAVWLGHDTQESDSTPEVLLASDAPDLGRLAARADAYMRERALAASPAGHGTNARITAFPAELADVRSLSVTAKGRQNEGDLPTISWMYVPRPETSGADSRRGGWWITHYFPNADNKRGGQDAAAAVEAQSETRTISGLPERRYLHVGYAQPSKWSSRLLAQSRFVQSLPGEVISTPTAAATVFHSMIFSYVRSTSWTIWHEPDENAFRAELRFRLHDVRTLPE